MYDMYPEWGPARHYGDQDENSEKTAQAVQSGIDLRDNGGERPDDN